MILTKVKNEVGATAIEYGLLASLIAVSAIGGMSAVGMNLSNTYCTISKHLGGSGTCSSVSTGGSTGGENGTGGGGSSTGSGNGTTGITTKDDMDNLKNSLVDNFNDDYLDSSLGGSNSYDGTDGIGAEISDTLSLMTDYNKKNPDDQITNVFGLYDALTHQPITSFKKASEGLKNSYNIKDGSKSRNTDLEVTTQQGHVYTISGSGIWRDMRINSTKGS